MRFTLRQVRKNLAQKTFGKAVAVSLTVALIVPPQLGFALSLNSHGGG